MTDGIPDCDRQCSAAGPCTEGRGERVRHVRDKPAQPASHIWE